MQARSVLLLLCAAAPLPPQLSDPNTAEGWIWQQVHMGKVANLNERCRTEELDIQKRDDERWREPCRRVAPNLLRALLTQPDLADQAPYGVGISGAYIDGGLDLFAAHIRAAYALKVSWIAGAAVLADARLDSSLSLDGTLIEGELLSEGTSVSNLFLSNVKFGGPVDLNGAHVEGQMVIEDASIADRSFYAEGLYVGANLLSKVEFGGQVDLKDAHINGQMGMEDASIANQQAFNADRLHVGGLILHNVQLGGQVDLNGAQIDGQMDIRDASIANQKTFNAERLHVGSDLFVFNVMFGGEANLRLLAVDGGIDLRDSHVRRLDLGGAVIRDDLLVGGRKKDGSEHWLRWDACDPPGPCLNLRNTRIGNLQDDERAWQLHDERARPDITITLEGFTYTHLGGIGGEQRQDMRNRSIAWWHDWLSRDPVYSSQPYTQLAGVLVAAGNRDGAADIRFFGRDRERTELLRGCTWPIPYDPHCGLQRWGTWLGMSALQVFIGYGIGDYSFRAVGWVLVLMLIGTGILCFAPGVRGMKPIRFITSVHRNPRQRSLLWCLGASLHKVLPLISISQEFSDFFNDPNRERLRPWQHVAFGALAVCGWVLAGFVLAAFSGLSQS